MNEELIISLLKHLLEAGIISSYSVNKKHITVTIKK